MERNPNPIDPRDRQLHRLAGQMRDTGIAPDRDLWPEINAALDRRDTPRRRTGWLRMTAVAAALALLLAAGWTSIRLIGEESGALGPVTEAVNPANGMAVIDQALDELKLALADDPENRNLSHLVLMVHKTRGNLLRRNSENLLRD